MTVLSCLVDDAYYPNLNPRGRRYEALKRLSDSEVLTLALLQQLRGVEECCRSFLRGAVPPESRVVLRTPLPRWGGSRPFFSPRCAAASGGSEGLAGVSAARRGG